jgi:predicted enzyme related to lactoylglutathione lyase
VGRGISAERDRRDRAGTAAAGERVTASETGIILTTDDIDATHAQLKSIGVDVDAEVARMGDPVPPMFWFRDPDGNNLLVVQRM